MEKSPGELVNADRTGQDPFVIRPYAGGQINLAASSVLETVVQSPIKVAYAKKRFQVVDSVEGHLELAQWCQSNRLKQEQKFHLQQVLQIDSDQPTARSLLGFSLADGKWMTKDEINECSRLRP